MANTYTVENLLNGKIYISKSLSGEIVEAEKHPKGIYYADADAYLVRIRKDGGGYTYRTVAVRND